MTCVLINVVQLSALPPLAQGGIFVGTFYGNLLHIPLFYTLSLFFNGHRYTHHTSSSSLSPPLST